MLVRCWLDVGKTLVVETISIYLSIYLSIYVGWGVGTPPPGTAAMQGTKFGPACIFSIQAIIVMLG